ncbi:hypothetical protein PR048_030196 [Dryococelus australis]|uniref:Maturase n=1 Tax=Dryococelus australis TaxID=614101 RepID=A0ABQ9G897_9NEOP|nr:hypothetical protein PR048_030196 [Dryococelus australis]
MREKSISCVKCCSDLSILSFFCTCRDAKHVVYLIRIDTGQELLNCISEAGMISCGKQVNLLASHLGKVGSIPSRVTPGFLQVGIVPDNFAVLPNVTVAKKASCRIGIVRPRNSKPKGRRSLSVLCRRVFSGISLFPHPCIPALLHSHFISPSSALKTLLLRATHISQLNSTKPTRAGEVNAAWRGKREIPEETRRPTASSGTVPNLRELNPLRLARSSEPMRAIEVSMARRQNGRAGEAGDLRYLSRGSPHAKVREWPGRGSNPIRLEIRHNLCPFEYSGQGWSTKVDFKSTYSTAYQLYTIIINEIRCTTSLKLKESAVHKVGSSSDESSLRRTPTKLFEIFEAHKQRHGRGEREILEKTRRPSASSSKIPTYENSRATSPGIEPGLPRWETSSLTTTAPRPAVSQEIPQRWLLISDRDFEPPILAVRNELHLDLQSSSELEWSNGFTVSILDPISDQFFEPRWCNRAWRSLSLQRPDSIASLAALRLRLERNSRTAVRGQRVLETRIHRGLTPRLSPSLPPSRNRLPSYSGSSGRPESNTAIRVRSPACSLPGFRMWESYWTMPLAGGFSRDSPAAPSWCLTSRHADVPPLRCLYIGQVLPRKAGFHGRDLGAESGGAFERLLQTG